MPVTGIGLREFKPFERLAAVAAGNDPSALVGEQRGAGRGPCASRRSTPAAGFDLAPVSPRRRRCETRCRAGRTPAPRRRRRSRRRSCRCSRPVRRRKRCAAASSLSTRPPSPAMYSPPAAGRIAYRLSNFGLSVRSNHGSHVLPPSVGGEDQVVARRPRSPSCRSRTRRRGTACRRPAPCSASLRPATRPALSNRARPRRAPSCTGAAASLAARPSSCLTQLVPPSLRRRMTPSWPTAQPCLSLTKYTAVRSELTGTADCFQLCPPSAERRCGRAVRPPPAAHRPVQRIAAAAATPAPNPAPDDPAHQRRPSGAHPPWRRISGVGGKQRCCQSRYQQQGAWFHRVTFSCVITDRGEDQPAGGQYPKRGVLSAAAVRLVFATTCRTLLRAAGPDTGLRRIKLGAVAAPDADGLR